MVITAVSGKIGSGKSTFCSLLAQALSEKGERTEIINFADKLKKISFILFGYHGYTQEEKNIYLEEWNDTVGGLLQTVGTKAMRENFNQEVWVKSALSNLQNDTFYIVGDCRFPNEAEAVKKREGLVVRLNGDPAKIRKASKRDLNHSSETALDNYDGFNYIYENDKSFEELKQFVKEYAEVLISSKSTSRFE